MESSGDPFSVAKPLIFDTLTRTGGDGSPLASLAVRWESENNSQRWQFWLRTGVRFHDGTELSPDDVLRSLNDECAPSCQWRTLRRVGDSVVLTTDSPSPALPQELARTKYAIARKRSDGDLDGTGPFRISARGGSSLALAAVDDSWSGRPFLDSIEIDGRREPRTQMLDMSVGRADIVEMPPEMVRQALQSHLALRISQPVELLALVIQGNLLSTPQSRESVADAVDRETIWSVLLQKQGEISASLLPDNISGYSFLFPTARDLARATVLASAIRGQLTLAVESPNPQFGLVAERLALNLHDAGLNVQVRSSAAKPDLTLKVIPLEAANDRAALHQMLEAFGKDGDDGGRGPDMLYQIERAFLEDHTVIPLAWMPRIFAVGTRVRGLELAPDGTPLLADVSLKAEP